MEGAWEPGSERTDGELPVGAVSVDGRVEPLGACGRLGALGADGSCVLGSEGVEGSWALGKEGVEGSCVLGSDVLGSEEVVGVLGRGGVEGSSIPVAASDVTATNVATTNTTAAIRQTLP